MDICLDGPGEEQVATVVFTFGHAMTKAALGQDRQNIRTDEGNLNRDRQNLRADRTDLHRNVRHAGAKKTQ
ncbi:MAG TPA: hypothetical protein VKF36_02885 [Syntrophorhabdales bacterium]|nr:hypothetical protein [Syntrophorhabdales bacterium]